MFGMTLSALSDVLQLKSGTYTVMIRANRDYDDDAQHSHLILLQYIYS